MVPGAFGPDSLSAALRQGGDAVRIGGLYVTVLNRVEASLDVDGSALRLFLAAEDVRDSLRNRALAASLFEELAARDRESVLAPKALLALADLRPAAADSVVASMRERYPDSPYVLVLAGRGQEAFEALEDSLAKAARESRRRGVTGEAEGTRRDGRRVRNE